MVAVWLLLWCGMVWYGHADDYEEKQLLFTT